MLDYVSYRPLFVVLGFLHEYAGRRIVAQSDLVEQFFGDEHAAALFAHYLHALGQEQHLGTPVRRERRHGQTYFYSHALTQLIDAVYLRHGLTGSTASGATASPPGSGVEHTATGRISAAVFPAGDHTAKLSYLLGAYHRYGEQNAFRLANAYHKVQLVKQLLHDVGSPSVTIWYPPPDRVPAVYRVVFEPTADLRAAFGLQRIGGA
jgi:hypothetical protein